MEVQQRRTMQKLLLLFVVVGALLTREGNAVLTITQGRRVGINLELIPIVGVATVELGGSPSSRPTYYFDCITNQNNGSGLVWTKMSTQNRFQVVPIPNGGLGKRLNAGNIDYGDLDVYTCTDQYSDDTVSVNITGSNPAIIATEETVEVVQGLTAELEVYVSGYPVPTERHMSWYRPDGSMIMSSDQGVSFQDSSRRMILSNVQASQMGLYECEVLLSASPFMGTSTMIQLNVYVRSTIMTEPVESIDTVEWEPVTLTCTASGTPTPVITWEREGEAQLSVNAQISHTDSMTGNTVTSQLVFSRIRYEDRGRYRCRADNVHTTAAMSRYSDIRVTPALRLIRNQVEVGDIYPALPGVSISLECFGSGTLVWNASTGVQIPFGSSGDLYQSYDSTRDSLTLMIRSFSSAMTAVYSCMTNLTDAHNNNITASVLITNYNPAVVIHLRSQYVLLGNSTALEARVYASPVESATIRWYHNQRLINTSAEAKYRARSDGDIYRLEVNNVTQNEVGLYRIVVSLNGMSANDTIMLSFPDPPSATVNPSSITVNEGEVVRILCEAGGSGTLNVSWTMADGSSIPVGVQENGNELFISTASRSHPGIYVCSVRNLAGTSSDSVTLNVNHSPIAVVRINEITSVPERQLYHVFDDGSSTPTITCSSDGYPSPAMSWVQESGRGLPSGISQDVLPNGNVQLRWKRPVEFTDSGTYFCESFNNIGNSTATLELLVKIEPSISSIYSFSSKITTQDSQTFMYTIPLNYVGSALVCTARGWPAPQVEWLKDGQPLQSSHGVVSESSTMVATVSARLTWISEFAISDAGKYECVVHKPNTVVAVTSQAVQLIAGAEAPSATPPSCSIEEQSVFFQIRVFATECTSAILSPRIAAEFRDELVNVLKTECNCLVTESELEILGSPQCSSKVNGATVFRGKIETLSQSRTEQLFCALFSWQQKSPLIQIDDHLRAVDSSCSLKASSSYDSEECVAPAQPGSVIETMEIVYIAVAILVLVVLVACLMICCVGYYFCRRSGRKAELYIEGMQDTEHTYARTESFSKYSQSGVRLTNMGPGVDEPVYSTLTRGTEPPHEAVALSHLQTGNSSENVETSESIEGEIRGQAGASASTTPEAYQIPVNSQETLTSLAPGSIGNFQAMKRHGSSTSGYDSTSFSVSQIQKTSHHLHSPTDLGSNVISATNPWNDYEQLDGDDIFSPPNSASLFGDSPTTPGRAHGRQQNAGSFGIHQSPRSLRQPITTTLSSSLPRGVNPPHNEGSSIFAVVEEDDTDETISSHEILNEKPRQSTEAALSSQQSFRFVGSGSNHSPSVSTGSSSPHVMKQALMMHFQSAESVTQQQRTRESDCSEPPPPYTSRPSSEAVVLADSADSAVADKAVQHQRRPWYQASNASLDSNTPSPSPTRTPGGHIEPYAMIHNEHIPYTQNSSRRPNVLDDKRLNSQQKGGFQTKQQVQPYAEPVRSSNANLGPAHHESATIFEVVV